MTSLPFLRYELRRHLVTAALGLVALAVLPITQRVITDDVGFWDGAWNVWGAVVALYVVMPLLVLAMTASGWARERSLHTLEWLYARPLSSGALFSTRSVAIAVPALLWSVLALALHSTGATELEQALSTSPGLPGPALLLAVQLGLALGAGLLSSALARSPEAAFRASLLLVAAAWTTMLVVRRLPGTADVLHAASRAGGSSFLDQVSAIFLLSVGAAWTAAAWHAIARDPDGSHRLKRALSVAGPATAGALAAFVALLHAPYLALEPSPYGTSLADGRGLTFRAAPGLPGLAHPVLTAGGRSTVLRDAFVLSPRQAWSHGAFAAPDGRAAIIATYRNWLWSPGSLESRWILVGADGVSRRLALPAVGGVEALGWSPSGRRFAWRLAPWGKPGARGGRSRSSDAARLAILEPDLTVRTVDVPSTIPSDWRAAWVDDGTLLIADTASRWDEEGIDDHWAILDLDRVGATIEPRELPSGVGVAAPPLYNWAFGSMVLPRLGGAPVVLLVDAVAADPSLLVDGTPPGWPPRLARLDARSESIDAGIPLPGQAAGLSMGNLRSGELVWASSERALAPWQWDGGPTTLYRLASFDAEPRLLCTVPRGRAVRFVGQSGPWAIWESIWYPEYQLWGCNLETGEAREMVEWRPWAHGLATIGDRGLWTPDGWVPLAE